jgi:PleD family two-component response regulator
VVLTVLATGLLALVMPQVVGHISAVVSRQVQAAERTARTDALTGVFNRRFMEEALTREVGQADRHHRKLSVVLSDV